MYVTNTYQRAVRHWDRYNKSTSKGKLGELDQYLINKAYYEGQHFKAESGQLLWIGAVGTKNDPHSAEILAEIEKAFVSYNPIKECVDRYIDGVLNQMPQ